MGRALDLHSRSRRDGALRRSVRRPALHPRLRVRHLQSPGCQRGRGRAQRGQPLDHRHRRRPAREPAAWRLRSASDHLLGAERDRARLAGAHAGRGRADWPRRSARPQGSQRTHRSAGPEGQHRRDRSGWGNGSRWRQWSAGSNGRQWRSRSDGSHGPDWSHGSDRCNWDRRGRRDWRDRRHRRSGQQRARHPLWHQHQRSRAPARPAPPARSSSPPA